MGGWREGRMHVRIRIVPESRKRGPTAGRMLALSKGRLDKHFERLRSWEPGRRAPSTLKLRLARASPKD